MERQFSLRDRRLQMTRSWRDRRLRMIRSLRQVRSSRDRRLRISPLWQGHRLRMTRSWRGRRLRMTLCLSQVRYLPDFGMPAATISSRLVSFPASVYLRSLHVVTGGQ